MSEVGERLGEAIAMARMSRREFGRVMAEREGGRSYARVNEYLQGRVTPPIDFLESAADLLQVRAAWLAFDDGEATPEDEALARTRRRARTDLPLTRVVERVFEEEFPPFERLNLTHQRSMWQVYMFLIRSRGDDDADAIDDPDAEEYAVDDPRHPQWRVQADAARSLGRALRAPLDAFGVDPASLGPLELHRYVEAACSALLFLVDQGEIRRFLVWAERRSVVRVADQG